MSYPFEEKSDHELPFFFPNRYDFANSNVNDEFLNKMNPHHVPDVVGFLLTETLPYCLFFTLYCPLLQKHSSDACTLSHKNINWTLKGADQEEL